MPNDLRDDVAALRRLKDAASPLPWCYDGYSRIMSVPICKEIAKAFEAIPDDAPTEAYSGIRKDETVCRLPISHGDTATPQGTHNGFYVEAAVNLAPRLADAWEQAMATVAERDAEILRLKAACAMAWEHLDRYGYRGHEDQIKSQDAVFAATRPYVDFTGRL